METSRAKQILIRKGEPTSVAARNSGLQPNIEISWREAVELAKDLNKETNQDY